MCDWLYISCVVKNVFKASTKNSDGTLNNFECYYYYHCHLPSKTSKLEITQTHDTAIPGQLT